MDDFHTSFALLPPELTEQIACHLPLEDLRCLRLTCTTVAQKTAHYIGHTYCTDASTNFSRASIDRLEAISSSTWAKHIKVFTLVGDGDSGRDATWYRDASGFLFYDSPYFRQACTILSRFTNCQGVHVRMPSWFGEAFHHSSYPFKISSIELLSLGFLLIADSSLPLQALCIKATGSSVVTDIQNCQITWPGLQRALSQLKDLSFNFHVSDGEHDCIQALLSQASYLEKLSLNLNYVNMVSLASVSTSNLRQLMLHGLRVFEPHLTKLLLQCRRHLQILRFHRLRLAGSWKNIYLHLESFDQLESISFRDLRSGRMFGHMCSYGDLAAREQEVLNMVGGDLYLDDRKRVPRIIVGIVYTGQNTKQLLNILAASIVEPS